MVLLRELATQTLRLSVARPAGKSSRGPVWPPASCERATKAGFTRSTLATRPASRSGLTHRDRVLMGDVPQVLRGGAVAADRVTEKLPSLPHRLHVCCHFRRSMTR